MRCNSYVTIELCQARKSCISSVLANVLLTEEKLQDSCKEKNKEMQIFNIDEYLTGVIQNIIRDIPIFTAHLDNFFEVGMKETVGQAGK